MRKNKLFKAVSYVVLSLSLLVIILSSMTIAIKNSEYLNEEKYFETEKFTFNYLMSLQDISDKLIHNNSSYNCVKDGDLEIYHIYDYYTLNGNVENEYSNYTNLENINFLVIYKNKAITNINANTIEDIKKQINLESNQDKKVDIVNGILQTNSQSISKYGEKYLNKFSITYYTTDTEKTDKTLTDGRYIEYISTSVKDFEIYSSYKEKINQNYERKMLTSFLDMMRPIENNAYVILPVSVIITILLIIYLTASIGHSDEKNTVELNIFDYIPIEIIIFFAILISCIPFILLGATENDYNAIISIAITAYFVIYICAAIIMTTLIKRVKTKQVLKTSLTGKFVLWVIKLLKKIVNKTKEIWKTFTYSANTTFKVVVSAGITIFVWIIVFLLAGNTDIFPVLIVALVCYIMYKVIKILKEYSQLENKLKEIYEGNNKNVLNANEFAMPFKGAVTYLNDISNGFENAVQERMKSERMKAELITNVSHDIKTPLTSIINYVDLIKQENVQNKKIEEYIEILDNKSQRLKKLTEDLVEASKISTGNISLNLEKINVTELIKQATGEFEDKFRNHGLEVIMNSETNVINIMADSRYMYRVIENLYSNISKYALENSRVYVDIKENEKDMDTDAKYVSIEMKNISKDKLNISAEELMQRFVRGDKSRTTEGSGLGISIAQNLTELQNGQFELKLDGDLFKVKMIFKEI